MLPSGEPTPSRIYRSPALPFWCRFWSPLPAGWQPIPPFSLPLKPDDQEPTVDLGQILHDLYDRASYDLRLDYKADPDPPLMPAEAVWADELLRQKGLR